MSLRPLKSRGPRTQGGCHALSTRHGNRCAARSNDRCHARNPRAGHRRVAGRPAARRMRHPDAERLLGDVHVHRKRPRPWGHVRPGRGQHQRRRHGQRAARRRPGSRLRAIRSERLDRAVRQHQRQPRVLVPRLVPRRRSGDLVCPHQQRHAIGHRHFAVRAMLCRPAGPAGRARHPRTTGAAGSAGPARCQRPGRRAGSARHRRRSGSAGPDRPAGSQGGQGRPGRAWAPRAVADRHAAAQERELPERRRRDRLGRLPDHRRRGRQDLRRAHDHPDRVRGAAERPGRSAWPAGRAR